jgi:hypothetical protein
MDLKLPKIISDYIDATNAHNPTAILACFSAKASVRDQNQTVNGKQAIKGWIATVTKQDSRFEPLKMREDEEETALLVNVSGNFPGSPLMLNYQFKIKNGKISSLSIT